MSEIANRFNIKSKNHGNVVATPRQRAMVTGTSNCHFGKGKTFTAEPGS